MKYPPLPGETFDAWLARIQPLRRGDLDRRVRIGGVRPMTLEELSEWPTLFASDREHEAFLAWLREGRQRYVG